MYTDAYTRRQLMPIEHSPSPRPRSKDDFASSMCIDTLTEYACGHATKKYINRHCQCALIVKPMLMVNDVYPKCMPINRRRLRTTGNGQIMGEGGKDLSNDPKCASAVRGCRAEE